MRCRSKRTGHLRPISFWVVALLELGWGCPVQAEEDWLPRSRAILDAAGRQSEPEWLNGNPSATDIRKQAMEALQAAQKPQPNVPASIISSGLVQPVTDPGLDSSAVRKTFVIYASTSLGEAGLLDILEEAAGRDDVLVVFRGMKPGQKLQQFVREIHALVRRFGEGKQPHVIIDPNRFRHANVTVAPTLTLEENGKVLARVQGITGIQWLRSKTDGKPGEKAKTQDFGSQGPTREIAEVDLIEEMQRRAAQN